MRRVDLLVEARKHSSGFVGAGRDGTRRLRTIATGLRSSRLLGSPSFGGSATSYRGPDAGGDEGHGDAASAVYAAPPVQPRDLRLIDPLFGASQDPAILPRRGCIVLNLPPVRAIITQRRCFFIPDSGVDEQLRTLADRIRLSAESAETAESAAVAAAAAAAASSSAVEPKVAVSPPESEGLPWELHVLEALLLTVTTTLRKEIAAVKPYAKKSSSALGGGGVRRSTGATGADCCQTLSACFCGRSSSSSSHNNQCYYCCCGGEDVGTPTTPVSPGIAAPSLRGVASHPMGHVRAVSASDRGVGLIASMAVVRRELSRVQEHGRALSRCLEDLLESPLAMARLDLTAVERARTAEAERLKRKSDKKKHHKRGRGGRGPHLRAVLSEGNTSPSMQNGTFTSDGTTVAGREDVPSRRLFGADARLPAVAEVADEHDDEVSPASTPVASSPVNTATSAQDQTEPVNADGVDLQLAGSPAKPAHSPQPERTGGTGVRGASAGWAPPPLSTMRDASSSTGGRHGDTEDARVIESTPDQTEEEEDEEEELGQDEATIFFGDAVELLLESYLGEVEAAMGEARTLQSDTETAERQLSLVLAASRNALLRVDVTVSVVSVALALLSVVGGFMGMNVPNGLETADTGLGGPFFTVVLTSCIAAVLMTLLVLVLLQRFLSVTND